MGINNYSDIQNIETAFGITFKHPDTVNGLTEKIDAYQQLKAINPDPRDLRDAIMTTPPAEWGPLIREWAPNNAIAETMKSLNQFRIDETLRAKRSAHIDRNRWHYLNQLPLQNVVDEFIKAVVELGDDWNDSDRAMKNGKGGAASIAHATEQQLLTLNEFKGHEQSDTNARFVAAIIEPPALPTLYAAPRISYNYTTVNDEDNSIRRRHINAKEVRDRAHFGIREIAAGNKDTDGMTFTFSAPKNETEYQKRVEDWKNIGIQRSRT